MSIVWEMAEPSALEELYRFRYEQYFADREGLPGTDHEARRVWLPHDDRSWHFAARSPEGEVVAVGTATPASEPSLYAEWQAMFEVPRLEPMLSRLVLISRVIVAQEARNSALFGSLCLHLARTFTAEGYHYAAHYCAPALVPLYERLGYRLYGRGKSLDSGAFRLPMVLLIDDVPYLRSIRSPLGTLGRDAEANREWVELALRTCPELAKKPLCAMPDAERRSLLTGHCPELADKPELLRSLRRGAVIPLEGGDVLAPEGVDEGAFFVLSGTLEQGGSAVQAGSVLHSGGPAVSAREDSLVISAPIDKE